MTAEGKPLPRTRIDLSQPPEVRAVGWPFFNRPNGRAQFCLPKLWQLHLYGYHATIDVDGNELAVQPGTMTLIPPGSAVAIRVPRPGRHYYVHFSVEYGDVAESVPMMVTTGAALPMVTDLMSTALAATVVRPAQTRAAIWTILLTLADLTPAGASDPVRDYVGSAMAHIEAHLAESLSVPAIAAEVGISPNHLTRLFSRASGETIVGYVRRRRVEHAQHLLRNSTMSISAIAATVGIGDLQAFNKTCRAITGRSPRELRDA